MFKKWLRRARVCKIVQIFPLRYRGRGVSLTVCVNRLTSGLVALAFPLLERGFTAGGTFFLFSIFSVGTVWFYYVRKRGRRWGGLRKKTLVFLSGPTFLLGCAYSVALSIYPIVSFRFFVAVAATLVLRSSFLTRGPTFFWRTTTEGHADRSPVAASLRVFFREGISKLSSIPGQPQKRMFS